MTLVIATLVIVLFVAFTLLMYNTAYAMGKTDGYAEGCDDCKRGVIPQHHAAFRVYGATGTVGAVSPDLEEHAGFILSDEPREKPRHLRSIPAEDDPEDGA